MNQLEENTMMIDESDYRMGDEINKSPEMEQHLTDFWKEFCDTNYLDLMSADELLMVHHMDKVTLSDEQEQLVRKFIELWELSV